VVDLLRLDIVVECHLDIDMSIHYLMFPHRTKMTHVELILDVVLKKSMKAREDDVALVAANEGRADVI
jgi:hypothetical protein